MAGYALDATGGCSAWGLKDFVCGSEGFPLTRLMVGDRRRRTWYYFGSDSGSDGSSDSGNDGGSGSGGPAPCFQVPIVGAADLFAEAVAISRLPLTNVAPDVSAFVLATPEFIEVWATRFPHLYSRQWAISLRAEPGRGLEVPYQVLPIRLGSADGFVTVTSWGVKLTLASLGFSGV
jgi:hypothetical protein